MKYIGHRFVQYCRVPKQRRSLLHRLCGLMVVLLLLWVILCEVLLQAVTPQLIEEAAHSFVLSCMNEAIAEELTDEKELLFVTEHDGCTSLLQVDSSALTEVKTRVSAAVERAVNRTATVRVPIGSLCGLRVLNGRGPSVPLKLRLEGSADVTFTTELTSAGVNQSCHRVLMRVQVTAYSQSKHFSVQVTDETQTVLAETVVVGDVPSVMWSTAN